MEMKFIIRRIYSRSIKKYIWRCDFKYLDANNKIIPMTTYGLTRNSALNSALFQYKQLTLNFI